MITIPRATIQYLFDKTISPAACAASGDIVRFECCDCYTEQIDHDGKDFAELDMRLGNPITGPLYIQGAEPGDVLQIDILAIDIGDHGVMGVGTGTGIYDVEGYYCRRFDIRDGAILFDRGLRIPIRPMIGVIGTCPANETISPMTPGEHGGNMDCCELGAGTTLYLPVTVPGALLSVGDLDAVRGEGETACCAMEVSGAATLRVTVLKNCDRPTPFLETERACYTLAADASLDVCSRQAVGKMQRYLMERYGLSDVQAAMLLSLQGNLRITQVVNPRKGCMMEIGKDVLGALEKDE